MPRLDRLARAAFAAALLAVAAPAAAAQAPEPAERAQTAPGRRAERGAQRAAAARAEIENEVRPFFEEHLPPALVREGPRGLLWWQWIALPVTVLVALALGALLGYVTRRVLVHLASRTRATWDDELIERIASPLTALWAIFLVAALKPWLVLPAGAESVLDHLLRAATYVVVFWGGLRAIGVAFAVAGESPWARSNASLAGFLPLFRKMAKVLLIALGAVSVLNELGFQVASLLAGVGIGGIALALAAQKTVENLFGSVSISVDQPFRIGDFVKLADGTTGNVEAIGMRSTRIRTLDRTVVTIPNGKLAEMTAETFAARDRMRLFVNLGLVYGTTAAQMRDVLSGIERVLRSHPKIWPDAVPIRFTSFADSSLNVEVVAWFQTSDWAEFTLIRQEMLLAFMEVVERAGTSFAFPTRTLHVVGGEAGQPAPRDGAGEAGAVR
jgi:MscS family membrane protein